MATVIERRKLKLWLSRNAYDKNGKVSSRIGNTLQKNEDIKLQILELTSFLDDNCRWSERIYCIINDVYNAPKCKFCGNIVRYVGISYRDYCSALCFQHSNKGKKRNPNWCENISKGKTGKSRPDMVGANNFAKRPEVRQKISNSLKGRIGINTGKTFSQEHKDKISQAHKGKKCPWTVGSNNPACRPEVRAKISKSLKGRKGFFRGKTWEEVVGDEKAAKWRQTVRNSLVKKVADNNGGPNFNAQASEYFRWFDNEYGTQGQYALYGDGEYLVEGLGYWVDYINFDLKLIIEWDEEKHYTKDGFLREKDQKRQHKIQQQLPDFDFVRIRGRDCSNREGTPWQQ